ncbi:MAG: hypothetical protein ACI86H_001369 [bacterium]|jgi:hypothetical protein
MEKEELSDQEKSSDQKELSDQEKLINKRLAGAIREVIDNQIYDDSPPETGETLERLIEVGFTQDQAYDLMGRVVSIEVLELVVEGKDFDMPRYVEALEKLPSPFAKIP